MARFEFAVVALALLAFPAAAGTPPTPAEAIAVSEAAIGNALSDHTFTGIDGRRVRLNEFRGKPLVVSLIYTGCADVCPTVSNALADAVEAAREALGENSFEVVSIGFDARHDTPNRMRAFARTRGLPTEGWHWLAGEAGGIDRLAADLGFVFYPSAKGFDHMAQTSVIDVEGRVYRHVYGATFDPPALVEPLKDLILGRASNYTSVAGLVNRIKFFCTIYDPTTGRYAFDYSLFIMIAGGTLSLGGIGFVALRGWIGHWLRERRRNGKETRPA